MSFASRPAFARAAIPVSESFMKSPRSIDPSAFLSLSATAIGFCASALGAESDTNQSSVTVRPSLFEDFPSCQKKFSVP